MGTNPSVKSNWATTTKPAKARSSGGGFGARGGSRAGARRDPGLLSQVAFRTLRGYVQATIGERGAVPGVITCVQTFGSLAHVHPHLHVLLTDGAFRRDATFVPLPPHDPAVLEEAWRRAVLAWFVRQGWLESDDAAGMLSWPHSGFGA